MAKIEGPRSAFPDIHFALETMVVEGNLVAAHWYFMGTQT
jgi:predicted ester cyclase